jgi:ferritin-like metal-binding protein YciE
MKGLIKEAEELLEEDGEPATKDALLIAAAQKVEHYEIASYGTLCTWAEALGYKQALTLLKQKHRRRRDDRWTALATSKEGQSRSTRRAVNDWLRKRMAFMPSNQNM